MRQTAYHQVNPIMVNNIVPSLMCAGVLGLRLSEGSGL